jgi:hypothetical protein
MASLLLLLEPDTGPVLPAAPVTRLSTALRLWLLLLLLVALLELLLPAMPVTVALLPAPATAVSAAAWCAASDNAVVMLAAAAPKLFTSWPNAANVDPDRMLAAAAAAVARPTGWMGPLPMTLETKISNSPKMRIHMTGQSCVLFIHAKVPCLPNQESSARALISCTHSQPLHQQARTAP